MGNSMKICHIDTETTGVDHSIHTVHQISGMIEIGGKIVKEFDIKVRPAPGAVIEDAALKVGGISREQLEAYQPAHQGLREFQSIIYQYINKYDKCDKMWFVAYNAGFDWNMLQTWSKRLDFKYFGGMFYYPPLCTAQYAATLLMASRPLMNGFKLSNAAEELGIEFNESKLHDALEDVRISREIFYKFVQRYNGKECGCSPKADSAIKSSVTWRPCSQTH